MFSFKKILPAIILIASSIFLSSCFSLFDGPKLEKPSEYNIYINETDYKLYFEIDEYEEAEMYVLLSYKGPHSWNRRLYSETEFQSHKMDISSLVDGEGEYYFHVYVVSSNPSIGNSPLSSLITHYHEINLESPEIDIDGTNISWDTVTDADDYNVFINSQNVDSISNTIFDFTNYDIYYDFTDYEPVYIYVVAKGNGESSIPSNTIAYREHLLADMVTNIDIEVNSIGLSLLGWDHVDRAEEYEIRITDNTDFEENIVTVDNSIIINYHVYEPGEYLFEIKALENYWLKENNYTEYVDIFYIQLATTTIDNVSRVESSDDVEITWVDGSNYINFTIMIDNVEVINDHSDNTIILDPDIYFDFPNISEIRIKAQSHGYYLESHYSQIYYYDGIDELESPSNISFSIAESETFIDWDDEIVNDGYYVAIDNDIYYTDTNSLEVTGIVNYGDVHQVRVRTKSPNYTMYHDSNFSEHVFLNNKTNSISGFTDVFFYYFGFYDFHITSQEQMNAFIGYALMYHIDDINAYIDYSNGTISQKFQTARDSYQETVSYSFYQPQQISGKIYRFRMEHNYGMNPIATTNDPDPYTQSEIYQPTLSETGRDESFNDFASSDWLVEYDVYNTNQLFMTVNSNAKPVFAVENSIAEIVYYEVKDILRDIIDDEMSDFEKLLAIHDWIAFNTIYDRYLYELITEGGSSSFETPEYRSFYLEGVFIDNLAVCDGIAKAFSLMASLEGIQSMKVTGDAVGNEFAEPIGHAWNKVLADIDGQGAEWYVVDATWASVGIAQNKEEILTRRYFLTNDDFISGTHFSSYAFYEPEATSSMNYYTISKYDNVNNYYIESQSDLDDIFVHYSSNDFIGLEIRFDETLNNINNMISTAHSNATTMFNNFGISYISIGDFYYIEFSY